MPKEEDFLSANECKELQEMGYLQGKSHYLWYRNKHNRDDWELYKRNPHDNSAMGDKLGYMRWVSAVTPEQAQEWHDSRPKPPPERNVSSLTFDGDETTAPRRSACLFATTCRDDLISIVESYPQYGYIEITVYFWKED